MPRPCHCYLVVSFSVTLRARASLTTWVNPPMFRYQTNAAGKSITGTAITNATITCHSIVVLLFRSLSSLHHQCNTPYSYWLLPYY